MGVRRLLNNFLQLAGYELVPCKRKPPFDERCVSLNPEGAPKGWVLLAFILDPFLVENEASISNAHQHDLVSYLMARIFLQYGYGVDVIDYRNHRFVPKKKYTFLVSARTNLERLKAKLNPDCVTIAHLETSHFLFNNHAAYRRALDLLKRRKRVVTGWKNVEHNLAIEHADFATLMGNDVTAETYRYAGKPLYLLSGTSVYTYPWDEKKDFSVCRNRFMWLGSDGLVHKGLDRVLEAFAVTPECHLTICGPIERDKGFLKIYEKELYHTSNIETLGWVDNGSDRFRELLRNTVALVYPSCAEGKSGAVLTCMQGGIIPIVSRESGVDVHDFGLVLQDSSIEEIISKVKDVSSMSAIELEQRSRRCWEHARKYHTRERFEEEYRQIIGEIIEKTSSARYSP